LRKKLFNPTQQAFGSNIAQATEGATATVINITISTDSDAGVASQIISQIEAATGTDRIPATHFSRKEELIVVGPPPPPPLPIKREAIEASIKRALSKLKSIMLRGEQRSGRSELARAAVGTAKRALWVDFAANSQLSPTSVLNVALTNELVQQREIRISSFEQLVGRMPEGLVLVLDNVDVATSDTSFSSRLMAIARAAKKQKVTFICTSIHPLNMALDGLFEIISVPRYDDRDIEATLGSYGAPSDINRPQFRGYIRGLTQGEPELTRLLVEFLARHDWKLDDDDVWAGMLKQTFAEPLKSETQRRLLQTENEQTRSLLYRLVALMRPFTEAQALQIARIEPEIPQAAERLATLYGRWLQNDGESQWRTSSLLSGLGDKNLACTTKNVVHKTVVDWIIAPKTLNQLNTGEAITHLVLAEEFDQAGGMLLRALFALLNAGPDVEPGHLLSLWKGLPLPQEMSLSVKISIRGLQVALAIQRGLTYQSQLQDFQDLIQAAHEERDIVASFASLSMVALRLVQRKPIEALPFIAQSAQQQRQITDHSTVEAFDGHSSAEMFWAAAMHIRDRNEIRLWIAEVDKLPSGIIDDLMEAPFAVESATKMFDALWMSEQDLAEESRDWQGLLVTIDEFEIATARWNASLIAGCLLRARQAIRIVHLGSINDALEAANKFLVTRAGPNDAASRFLVAHGTGLWLTDLGRWDEALSWLKVACKYREDHLALHRQQNLLRYGHALYRAGTPEERPFLQAIELAETDNTLASFNAVRGRAEFATFLWLTGRLDDHYHQWSSVAQQTLAIRDESQRWKQLFVLVANHTSFWANRMAQLNTSESNMVAKPELGMFITDYADLSDRYSDKVLFVMPGSMSWFAERVGATKEAADWAKVAVDLAAEFTEPRLGKGFLLQAVPYAIETVHYRDAIAYAADAIHSLGAQDTIEIPEATLRDNPSLKRSRKVIIFPAAQTEANVIAVSVLPILLAIIAKSFRNRADATSQLNELFEICRSHHDSSGSPASWDAAIAVLESVRDGSLRYRDFVSGDLPSGDWPAQTIGLLQPFAMMMLQNDEAINMLRAQIRWANWLTQSFSSFRGIGRLLASSIANAWIEYINQNGFRFQRASRLIDNIQTCAVRGELGRIFIEISDALGASTPQNFRVQILEAVFKIDEVACGPF